jgi:hypothetical protein
MDLVTSATAAGTFISAHITHIIRVTFSETPPYAFSCPLEYQMHSSTGARLLGDACLDKAEEIFCALRLFLNPRRIFVRVAA